MAWTAEGFEFCQGTVEDSWIGPRGPEKVELVTAWHAAFGADRDSCDRCLGGMGFEGREQQT